MSLLLPTLLLACGAPSSEPQVEVHAGGLELRADQGIRKVEVLDPQGLPLAVQRPPEPVEVLEVSVRWGPGGPHQLRVTGEREAWTLSVEVPAERAPYELWLEAPVGQAPLRVGPERSELPLVLVEGRAVQVAAVAQVREAGPIWLELGDERVERSALPGEKVVLLASVSEASTLRVTHGEESRALRLVPVPVSLEEARQQLLVRATHFPAERAGGPDPARSQGRVTLPAAWWREVLSQVGLGARLRDTYAAWSYLGVELENTGSEPINVVLRSQVLDQQGQPEPAFRPRLRRGQEDTDEVRALLRVPAGQRVQASLPVHVDERLLDSERAAEERWTQRIEVVPLGSTAPLHRVERPLYVSRGSTAASLGFGAALLAAVLGGGLIARRLSRWLRAPTSELMTVALFGSLGFVVSAAAGLLGVGVAALLGPFSILVVGLVDDALRVALLATLITLLPRPGIAALSVLTSWLLSAALMGTVGPVELLLVAGRVFWLEGALWLFGLTRDSGWRSQGALARWLRLGSAFGLSSLAGSATSLLLFAVLYRLFYADWYVALVLAGPGFIYVLLACALAVPFADSLRRVQR